MQVYAPPSAVPSFHRGMSPLNHFPRSDSHSAYRPSSTTRSRSATNAFDASSRPHIREHYKSASLDPRATERLRSSDRGLSAEKQHMHRPSYPNASSYSYVGRDGRPVQVADGYARESSRYTAPSSGEQRYPAAGTARMIYQPAPPTSRTPVKSTSRPQASYSAPVAPDRAAVTAASRTERANQPVMPPFPYGSAAPPTSRAPDVDSFGRPHWNARDGVRQRPTDADAPLIHNALGWWPDQHKPLLHWDLSERRSAPRYTKRAFDAQELASSPFTPPLLHMKLILSTEYGWAFDISARRGERYITLQGLFDSIAALMYTRYVPHAYWTRASAARKEEILRVSLRRSGRRMPTVPPHRRPKTRGQLMEEAVLEDAEQGYTNMLVVDLLCDRVMFSGMEFVKEPNEWLLRTGPRWY